MIIFFNSFRLRKHGKSAETFKSAKGTRLYCGVSPHLNYPPLLTESFCSFSLTVPGFAWSLPEILRQTSQAWFGQRLSGILRLVADFGLHCNLFGNILSHLYSLNCCFPFRNRFASRCSTLFNRVGIVLE